MGTKNNPGTFDCYEKAESDEPMFILLARDVTAPARVLDWARQREAAITRGDKPQSDMTMVEEARACAKAMYEWRQNRGKA
jgi:hypothetical protein